MFRVQTLKAVTGVLLATSMLAGAPIAQAATGTRGAQAEIATASANLADREQRGNWQSGRNDRSSAQRAERSSPQRAERSQQRPSGGYERASRSSSESRPVRSTGESRSAERSGRDWSQSSRRSETAQTRSGRDWNRSDRRGSETIRPSRTVERNAQTDRTWSGRTNSGDGDRLRNVRDRNTSYRDRDRNGSYRDGYRDGVRTDRNGSYRDGYRDGVRTDRNGSYRDGHRDRERWNTRWRDNDRYDWHRYRSYNRDIYRMGRYYAPYRGYSYSRLYVGFSLGSLFYSSRYWINDPWRYRLPEAYGGYRWVRYYDDALLVDTYSGEVVDVIYDFFW